MEKKRLAENNGLRSRGMDGTVLDKARPINDSRHGQDESRQGAGRSDIEQAAFAGDRRPDLDERAQRPNQGWGGNEKRQGRG